MVHSFALDRKALASVEDLVRAAAPENNVELFMASGFTSLAEQGPRVEFAKQTFPEMGKDYDAFDAFFWHRPSFEHFTKDVPTEAGLLIGAARAMKIGENNVFDRIELWSNGNESELLAVGILRFGNNTLRFLIVQWLTPVHGVDILGWTTLDDIRLWHQQVLAKQAKKDRKHRRIRQTIVAGALAVPASLVPTVIFLQPWLLIPIGLIGVAMLLAGIDMTNPMGTLFCWVGSSSFALALVSMFYILAQITPDA
jgi:hypothetical protein